jgi:hypothetical protein
LAVLLVLPEPVRMRCALAEASSVGKRPAAVTSRSARAWRSAAWALFTLVLACSARSTRRDSCASPNRCHHCASGPGVAAVASMPAAHCAGTSTACGGAAIGATEAQPAAVSSQAVAAIMPIVERVMTSTCRR